MALGYAARQHEQRRIRGQRLQLQRQAFAQVASADAGRIQVLDVLERRFKFQHIDFELGAEHDGQLVQRLFEIAIVVDGVHQQRAQHLIAFR